MSRLTRGCLIGIAAALLVVVGLPIGLWFYGDWKWGRELGAGSLSKLRAEGKPLTVAELAPNPGPDSQNAAVVYQRVFRVQLGPGAPRFTGMAGIAKPEWKVIERYLGIWDRYEKLPRPFPFEGEASVRRMLARSDTRDALETMRRGSVKPRCVFPVNWAEGMNALRPHLYRFRLASELVAARALLSGREGRMAEAVAWVEVGLRMSRHAGLEPDFMAQQRSYQMQETILGAVEQLLSQSQLSHSLAERLDRSLREVDLDTPFAAAMDGERVMCLLVLDEGVQTLRNDTSWDWISCDPLTAWVYTTSAGVPLRKLERLAYLQYMDEYIAASVQPYRLAAAQLADLKARERGLSRVTPFGLGLYAYRVREPSASRDEAVARIVLRRTALALKVYKARTGGYPKDLAVLRQPYNQKLPKDPFSGQAFVYEVRFHGFRLYSIGPNLKDDSGRRERDPAGDRREDYDIVWECER